jgi:transcriptional regulator with XRE-family HTH domain
MTDGADAPLDPRRVAFGRRIRTLRAARGISQEQLADAAGVHRTYVSSLERGQRNVGLDNIYGLADALGVSPSKLFENEEL